MLLTNVPTLDCPVFKYVSSGFSCDSFHGNFRQILTKQNGNFTFDGFKSGDSGSQQLCGTQLYKLVSRWDMRDYKLRGLS